MLEFSANKTMKKSLARDAKDQVRLAFHGRIFRGNLCHRYLSQKICKQLTKTAIDTVVANPVRI